MTSPHRSRTCSTFPSAASSPPGAPWSPRAVPPATRAGRGRRLATGLLTVGTVLTLLAGCSSGGDRESAAGGAGGALTCPIPVAPMAIAVGAHANAPSGDLPAGVRAAATAVVAGASDQGGEPRFSVVDVDGRPAVTAAQAYRTDAANAIAAEDDQNAFLSALGQEIAKVRAQTPEVNDLAALDVAGRAVAGARPGTVVLVDSGLSTTAPLDFRQAGQLDAPVADTVAFLKASNALPNLKGATVVLAGLGDTAAPQAALSPAQRANLVALYTGIAQAAGAACVSVVQEPLSGEAPSDVPAVSTVVVPPPPTITPGRASVLPDDGSVGFRPDTAEFRDRAAAGAVLRPFADYTSSSPTRRLALTGTSARAGTAASQVELSTRRAEAVKALLVELGAPADRITTRGVGSAFPGYVNDVGPGGRQLPGPATANRKVIVEPSG